MYTIPKVSIIIYHITLTVNYYLDTFVAILALQIKPHYHVCC
jgi:hypothetical protein